MWVGGMVGKEYLYLEIINNDWDGLFFLLGGGVGYMKCVIVLC